MNILLWAEASCLASLLIQSLTAKLIANSKHCNSSFHRGPKVFLDPTPLETARHPVLDCFLQWQAETARMLLKLGASPNVVRSDGVSAFGMHLEF